jgi:hypothetical protein
MNRLSILLMRAVLAVLLAYFLCRIFFEGASALRVSGLAAMMLVLAYLFEYTRRKGGTHGNPQ